MHDLRVARSELILGGQKSGKTARAESLAASWLDRSADHLAVYIATAQAWDEEMREKAKRCAEQAGFTNVSRMIQRPAGSHVMGANNQWTRTTEETWLGRGTRGGREVPVVVTASGRVEVAPASQAN